MDNNTIYTKLRAIQQNLEAPKNQYNSFGKYKYRSCEDILGAVKPLLEKEQLVLLLNDEVVEVGGNLYVKATAKLTDGSGEISTTAYARESETKKGMDDSQITGSTSSYARKYALNGLFAIDDSKDSDYTNKHTQGGSKGLKRVSENPSKKQINYLMSLKPNLDKEKVKGLSKTDVSKLIKKLTENK